MWHTITRALGFSLAVVLLTIARPLGRSNAAMGIPAGSLAFTSLVPAGGSDGDPAPIAYFSGLTGTFLEFSAGVVNEAGVNGQSEIADNGDFYTQNLEAYRDCTLEEFTDPSPVDTIQRFSPPNTGTYSDLGFGKGPNNSFIALNHNGSLNHQFANQSVPSNGVTSGLVGAASGSVGYYAKALVASGPRIAVGRHDLDTDTPMSDFASEANHDVRSGSGGQTSAILVLRDETVLVAWCPRSGAGAQVNMIKHYATDGTLLHTYNLSTATAARDDMKLTQDVSGSETFWVSYYGTTGPLSGHSGELGSFPTYDYSRATKINISDGAFLIDFAWSNQDVQDFYDAYGYFWSPDIGFWITRQDCNMDYTIAEIRGAKKHGFTIDPRYTFFSLQVDGDDLVIKIPTALHGAPSKEVYRVKHGYSQRFAKFESRSKFEMRGQVSSIDPTTFLSKDDGWVELAINGRVYANGDDYDLIDPNDPVAGCRKGVTGLNTHNEYGWSIGMWQNEWLDCCYLDRVAAYCHPDDDDDDINDGTIGDCPPPGPGGSSFDGVPQGDRFVAPGGCPAVYVPPTGGGAVASAADPVDHQDLATLRTPLVSVDLTVCDGTVYRLAKSTLPRPGVAPCDARVLHFGAIPYPFSNRFGSMGAQTWQLEIADDDGKFRALLASGPNQYFKRWTADAFVEDDAERLNNRTRQRVARGRCVTVLTGDDDQRIVLVFTDEYSRHDSPFSLDRELPVALIGDICAANASSPDLVSVPEASEDIGALAASILLGECSDEYRSAENPPVTPIGIIPLRLVGQVNLGGEEWDAYFVCLYACHRIPALFGSNLDPDCPASVRLCEDLFDGTGITQFLVPGYSPWDAYFSHKYIEVTANGVTYWATFIFGRGPVSLQHVLQKVPLSANVDGVEETGDGTGALIDDAARQLQFLLDHPILRRTTSGLWGGVATYPDGIAKVRTSSIAAVKAIHDARLSSRYRGALIIDKTRAARDWLADALVSWHIDLWLNHHGQIVAYTVDDRLTAAALAGLKTFTDLHHIDEASFKITSELSAELENSVTYDAGPEPSSGRLTVPKDTVIADTSIANWGDVYTAQPLTFVGLHRPDVARDVASRRLVWTQNGITKGVFKIDLAGGAIAGGELIRLTHLAGISKYGWRDRVLQATDRALLIDDAEWQTLVNWVDAHGALIRSGGGGTVPVVGFKPLGSTVLGTSWRLGSSVAGTAYRLG